MKSKIIFLLLMSFGLASAQSGNAVLKKIQNKFKSISNFSADFVQDAVDQDGKSLFKLKGKFLYRQKNNFVVELKNGSIVSNGEIVWNYDAKQKRVVISNFSDDPTSFSLERYIFDYPTLCKVTVVKNENGNDEIIELDPKHDELDFSSAKIWKNSDDMITRMEIIDISGTMYKFQLNSIKINQNISDSKFNFIPPKGIKIIDLR